MSPRSCSIHLVDDGIARFVVDCVALAYVGGDYMRGKMFLKPETIDVPVVRATMSEAPLAVEGFACPSYGKGAKRAIFRSFGDDFLEQVAPSLAAAVQNVMDNPPYFHVNTGPGGGYHSLPNEEHPPLPDDAIVHSTSRPVIAGQLRGVLDGVVVLADGTVWRRCSEPTVLLDLGVKGKPRVFLSCDSASSTPSNFLMAFPYAFSPVCVETAKSHGMADDFPAPFVHDASFCRLPLGRCVSEHLNTADVSVQSWHGANPQEDIRRLLFLLGDAGYSAAMAVVERRLSSKRGSDDLNFRVVRDLYAAVRRSAGSARESLPVVGNYALATVPVVFAANMKRRRSAHVYRRLVREDAVIHVRRLEEEPPPSLAVGSSSSHPARRWAKVDDKFYEFLPGLDLLGALWTTVDFPRTSLPPSTTAIGDLDAFDPSEGGGARIDASMREATLSWLSASACRLLSTPDGFWRECDEPLLFRAAYHTDPALEAVDRSDLNLSGFLYPFSAFSQAEEDAETWRLGHVHRLELLRPDDFTCGVESILRIHHGLIGNLAAPDTGAQAALDSLTHFYATQSGANDFYRAVLAHYARLIAAESAGGTAADADEDLSGLF